MSETKPTAAQRAEWKRLATEMCHGDGPWKTILLLLAEVERLERERDELRQKFGKLRCDHLSQMGELEAAEAALRAQRGETGRMGGGEDG